MSNQNNVPTGPGWYYRIGGSIVDVDTDGDGLYYWITGFPNSVPVTDDGAWLGPVPMPGVIEALNDALTEAEAIMGGEYGDHYGPFAEMVDKARKLAGVTR